MQFRNNPQMKDLSRAGRRSAISLAISKFTLPELRVNDPFLVRKVVEISLNHGKLAKDYAKSTGNLGIGNLANFQDETKAVALSIANIYNEEKLRHRSEGMKFDPLFIMVTYQGNSLNIRWAKRFINPKTKQSSFKSLKKGKGPKYKIASLLVYAPEPMWPTIILCETVLSHLRQLLSEQTASVKSLSARQNAIVRHATKLDAMWVA